ncbi:phosphopentomutase [Akkermansiaceae bacterium]|nr:phosphopentomutase [Akkermansiaceae bacterium]MDB4142211.1 phosphopentomutase [Akkermansiaceae bacterium]MDB4615204.1 phosphopentomutase [Akkermansiaceae bacterium]
MWFILDSVGIGGAPDAAAFGDVGSDTLGHIAEWFIENEGRALALPNLEKLGLGEAYRLVHGSLPTGWKKVETPGYFAAASEVSTGKDTPSGHWELAGVPARWDWGYFPKAEECFPQDLLEELWKRGGLDGSLGHCHASGTEIIERLGEESVRSGKPIFYTSADSVFQIAAHEEAFGLDRLLKLCELARELTLEMNIGRVIARPFIGEAGGYERTANRKDYAVTPPKPTVLQRLLDDGKRVAGVGKIGDIFAHTGMSVELKASGHPQLWEKTREARQGSDLVMTNFVDFDMLYGHRRDPLGYGLALEEWDRELGKFLAEGHDDLIVITADHGNDPTWEGTDHTRERVPVLIHGAGPGNGGIRETFADVGATIAKSFGLKMDEGTPIL